ncbi:MAG: IS66 family insertion sequence element accessory protein TnpB [Bacteroidetes bacterium]|nr:IS66 family insertion sequence element accessory protein TnpB [Bacteroidota bacterium]
MILSFSNRYRYFVYGNSCDMRKGYDGLSGLVRNEFKKDPLLGDVFIFLSRTRNKIKLLHWQGDGFCIYSKRLEKGTFEIPKVNASQKAMELSPHQLQFILDGIVLSSMKKRVRYEHHFVDKKSMVASVSALI